MAKKVKRVISRVSAGRERVPTTLSWRMFVGKDGATHCARRGDAPYHARPVGKEWLQDMKSVRQMERKRLGQVKGGKDDVTKEAVHSPTHELSGDTGEKREDGKGLAVRTSEL